MSHFLKSANPAKHFVRTYIKNYKWKNEGIDYAGFKYYPRVSEKNSTIVEELEKRPYEATKLFRVQRIKPVKGNPYWEKEILKALHLDGKKGNVAVVKNIPEVNSLLWKVKHLVKVMPITYPDGFPGAEDVDCSYLREDGRLVVRKELKPTSDVLEATDTFEHNPKKLDPVTLRISARKKWLDGWDTSL